MTTEGGIGARLRTKSGFVRTGTLVGGTALAAAEFWIFGGFGGFGLMVLLIGMSYAGAWLCMIVMWRVVESDIERINERERQRVKATDGT